MNHDLTTLAEAVGVIDPEPTPHDVADDTTLMPGPRDIANAIGTLIFFVILYTGAALLDLGVIQ